MGIYVFNILKSLGSRLRDSLVDLTKKKNYYAVKVKALVSEVKVDE